jgi:hypothetical protein
VVRALGRDLAEGDHEEEGVKLQSPGTSNLSMYRNELSIIMAAADPKSLPLHVVSSMSCA